MPAHAIESLILALLVVLGGKRVVGRHTQRLLAASPRRQRDVCQGLLGRIS